ncbi:DMT family transporter [Aquibacillus sp. 3ASR75-11]|uniref:DMT family transporter n=1 Tax=Terrihalobacillus insolitus TaxID=2950438 RepID=A0A9X4AMV4_9BACI|nr:DMT family transporter [Terrihalobacillus insolitus]MDC3413129.1 DMT family transporter [Terrihalobacillus insolitus]MDC3425199.1 DMT family transporter [Terrihalobacillus insolitus]
MRIPPFNPYAAITVGVISVSTAAILVKLAPEAPASIIANYRLLLAVIIMIPFMVKTKHEFRFITKNDWILCSLAGVFLAFHFIFWFESLNYTSVASSVVLVTLQPIFAFLGTFLFYQERFSAGTLISMIIALTGSVIISWGDFKISGIAFYGDILAIIGAIMVTGYFLLGQNARKRLSLMTYTFVVYGVSSITLIAYNLILGNAFFGYPIGNWMVFIGLAIIPTFLGHTLFNWALKWVSTATISMAIVFEPIGASLLAYLILGEAISATQWLGGSIILFGLSLFIVSTSRKSILTISNKSKRSNSES